MSSVYISGPMTGIPDFNRPAFHAEATRLRGLGHQVCNPADLDLGPTADWADYMRANVRRLCRADYIVRLPGWDRSRGALLEFYLAAQLCIPLLDDTPPMQEREK